MRARGLEFSPIGEVDMYAMAGLNPAKLRRIADLLEIDPDYNALRDSVYSAKGQRKWPTSGDFNLGLAGLAKRVLQFLNSSNPESLLPPRGS